VALFCVTFLLEGIVLEFVPSVVTRYVRMLFGGRVSGQLLEVLLHGSDFDLGIRQRDVCSCNTAYSASESRSRSAVKARMAALD
jgi:hypothetical protein